MLAGKKIVILEKKETFNVNHKMALVKCGTVSFPGLSLANKRARARRFNHIPCDSVCVLYLDKISSHASRAVGDFALHLDLPLFGSCVFH